jgi:hypothetical protein
MIRTDPEPGRWGPERGEGRLKALFWTAILVAAAFVAYKEVPPRFAEYQLQDKIREEAIFASASRKTEEDVRKEVFEKIQDLGIPATKENIKIELNLRGCRISVEYTVPVDLIVYQHELHFNPVGDNRSL